MAAHRIVNSVCLIHGEREVVSLTAFPSGDILLIASFILARLRSTPGFSGSPAWRPSKQPNRIEARKARR